MDMKKGSVVTARLFGGKKAPRVVVEVEENTVIVCNQAEWDTAKLERREPEGIRLPISDLEDTA